MTLNLLYMMSTKDIFVFLKNYYMLTKTYRNMQ